jgi:hypothetical protein
MSDSMGADKEVTHYLRGLLTHLYLFYTCDRGSNNKTELFPMMSVRLTSWCDASSLVPLVPLYAVTSTAYEAFFGIAHPVIHCMLGAACTVGHHFRVRSGCPVGWPAKAGAVPERVWRTPHTSCEPAKPC